MIFTYPNGVEDHEGILRYRDSIQGANRSFWDAVEMQAWKNILFYLGHQWITPMTQMKFWRPLGLKRDQPRPVTNRVKPIINDLSSKLVGYHAPVTWGPGSDQDADYVAASVAERVNKAIERETEQTIWKPIAARWLALTGNCFVISSYDTSPETGTTFIQAFRCAQCGAAAMPKEIEEAQGVCPSCGSQDVVMEPDLMGQTTPMSTQNPSFGPALGERGEPLGVNYPRGRHMVELENVFTVRFDPQAERFCKSPYVRIARTRDRAWVEERYGEEFAESVSYSRAADPYSTLFDSIAFTSLGGGTMNTQAQSDVDRVAVERLWIRPHPTKAPLGIYAVIVGNTVAESRDYPYHDERGMAMLNITHLEFDQVPGRALAATRCDDIIPLQEELNELDAFIKLHHRRMANAVWTIPYGSDPTRISGEGGIFIKYNPLSTGHRPQREPGVMVPTDIYNYRALRKQEMDEIFGSMEVSRGEAPRGVNAYSALALLDERAQQAQSNVFANWALGWTEVSRQGLNIWREYADEERTISLGVGRWATQKFNKAQMIGAVDIQADIGQGRPMTMVAKMARIGQGIQEGVINVFDPQVRHLVLRAMGIPELMPDYNKDYERAGRILDQTLSAPDPSQLPPPPFPFENHSIHLGVLKQFMLDEQFEELDPWKKQAIWLRAMIHYQALREDILASASRAGQNPPRVGGESNGGGGGGDKHTTEQGVMDQERQGASPDVQSGVQTGQE